MDGFRHKSLPIWGMQSHPEAGPGFIRNQSLNVPEEEESFCFWTTAFTRGFFKMIELKTKKQLLDLPMI